MNSYNFSVSKSIEIFQPLCLRTGFLFQVVVFKKNDYNETVIEFFFYDFFQCYERPI